MAILMLSFRELRLLRPRRRWAALAGVGLARPGGRVAWGVRARADAPGGLQRYGASAAEAVDAGARRMAGWRETFPRPGRLQRVNEFFNRRIRFADDPAVGQPDYWATPLEVLARGAATARISSSREVFQPARAGRSIDSRLRMTYVRARSAAGQHRDPGHMVLGYYAEPGVMPLVLDNLVSSIRPARRARSGAGFSFICRVFSWGGRSGFQPGGSASRWRELFAADADGRLYALGITMSLVEAIVGQCGGGDGGGAGGAFAVSLLTARSYFEQQLQAQSGTGRCRWRSPCPSSARMWRPPSCWCRRCSMAGITG